MTLLLLGLVTSGWEPWGEVALGQTVPRTPPPTFTATPSPTPLVPPTHTPLPTVTPTFVPGQPTPTPWPNPRIELSADRSLLGPGEMVAYGVQIANQGGAAATGARLTLEVPWPLVISQAPPGAQILEGGHLMALDLGAFGPGQVRQLTVQASLSREAWPGQTLASRASLAFDQGAVESAPVFVHLPPPLLPAAGGQ